MDVEKEDKESLRREKYENDPAADMREDLERLKQGEPLAYVIGNQPFLGLTIGLESRPLIPRPETEWWTELLIERIGNENASVLDLCAGSGAIGLALLKYCRNAKISFGELRERHVEQIRENLETNGLDETRADIRKSDLLKAFPGERFTIIATNPPYIPDRRELPESVEEFEPKDALYAGEDGLSVIRVILKEAKEYLLQGGELWMECDIDNVEEASRLAETGGALRTEIRTDPYGRPRLLVAYY